MRLIDLDALRADYGMAEDCKNCKTGYRSCEYDRIYSKMDFCGCCGADMRKDGEHEKMD